MVASVEVSVVAVVSTKESVPAKKSKKLNTPPPCVVPMTEPPWSAEGRITSGVVITEDELVELPKSVEGLLEDVVSVGVVVVVVSDELVVDVVSAGVGAVVVAGGVAVDVSVVSVVSAVVSASVGVVVVGVVIAGGVTVDVSVVVSAGVKKSINPPKKDERKSEPPSSASRSKSVGAMTAGVVTTGEVVAGVVVVGVVVGVSVAVSVTSGVSVEVVVDVSGLVKDSSNTFNTLKYPCMVVKAMLSVSTKSIPVISIE